MPRVTAFVGPIPKALGGWSASSGRPQRGVGETIYVAFRDAILAGELVPQTRLAPSRLLAAVLGVARSTVQLAFDRLSDEGYVIAVVGRGTIVANVDPIVATEKPRTIHLAHALPSSPIGDAGAVGTFRAGVPALDRFPIDAWLRASRRAGVDLTQGLLDYGDAAGYSTLRAAVISHAQRTRGIRGDARRVIIVAGAQYAFSLIATTLLRRGDRVCIEDPDYLPLWHALERAGASLIPIPVDDDGFNVQRARARCPAPRLVAITPSHQFPLGVRMVIGRRLALLQWMRDSDGYIIEDDYDSEFHFGSAPLPAIASLDAAERVIYVGTFSKTVFPALRLAYIIAPTRLLDDLVRVHADVAGTVSTVTQATLAEFIGNGDFGRHLRRMTRLYTRRRGLLRAAIRRAFHDDELHLRDRNEAGLHLTAMIHRDVRLRDTDLVDDAAKSGVIVQALSAYTKRARLNGLVFGYGVAVEDEIEPSIALLRSAWDRLLR